MTAAYVDTSCLVAIRFSEPGSREMSERLGRVESRFSSNLLVAEYLGALARDGEEEDGSLLEWMRWILPDRSLQPEIERVLEVGNVRGSDLWHLATALYVAESTSELPFLTLDARQREIAEALGFQTDLTS